MTRECRDLLKALHAWRNPYFYCDYTLQLIGFGIDPSNAVWAGPVSALRWVPLSAYAADGKPATCSKGHAVQWDWRIVRWGCGNFIRTRYRRRLFLSSLQESGGLVTSVDP